MHPLLRFTLDLFESSQLLVPVNQAPFAIENIAISGAGKVPSKPRRPEPVPAHSVSGGLDAVHFRHPQASRELRLGDALVAYEFKRGQRRSIGFSVGPDGLAVRAPKWVTLTEVDTALKAKSSWILRKLHDARERHARLSAQVIDWRDGASLPYLGQPIILQLDPHHGFGGAGAELVTLPAAADGPGNPMEVRVLRLSLPHSASAEQIRDVVQAWLMRQAKQLFQQRLDHFAPLLGVQWKKLGLSNAGTRWGSAKADGSIRLNWRLIHLRLSVIDYVVAHELSHLRVMDHSPRFWDTVRSVVPDYAALRHQLKNDASPR
jgi:predicted metal-dependent hydrolase